MSHTCVGVEHLVESEKWKFWKIEPLLANADPEQSINMDFVGNNLNFSWKLPPELIQNLNRKLTTRPFANVKEVEGKSQKYIEAISSI